MDRLPSQPTTAETDVLMHLAEPGASIATAAASLGISERAARARLARLYQRLGVNTALQAWVRLHRLP